MTSTSQTKIISKPLRRRRLGIQISLALVVLAVAFVLSKRSPSWFQHTFTSDAAMETRGAEFEQGIAAQFTKVRGQDREWAIKISETQMNEWLASRLPKWLEYQGKSAQEFNRKVQVRCEQDHMDIAAENFWGVGVIQIAPKMQPATQGNVTGATLNVSPTSAAIGSLFVPTFIISTFGPTDMFESLNNAEFRLADGRRVQVIDVEVLPGEIRMQLNTSPTKE